MPIVPGGFDQQPSYVTVACLGDRASAPLAAGGVLARNQTEERHQASGGVESHEVVQLGHKSHGGEGVDTSEAAQGCHHSGRNGACWLTLSMCPSRPPVDPRRARW